MLRVWAEQIVERAELAGRRGSPSRRRGTSDSARGRTRRRTTRPRCRRRRSTQRSRGRRTDTDGPVRRSRRPIELRCGHDPASGNDSSRDADGDSAVGDVAQHDCVGADLRTGTDAHRADHLPRRSRSGACPDRRSPQTPGEQPIVTNGLSTTLVSISTMPSMTTWPCGMYTPGCTHHRIADGDLAGDDRQPVQDTGRTGTRRVWQRAFAR